MAVLRQSAAAAVLLVLSAAAVRADGLYVGFVGGRTGVKVDVGTEGARLDSGAFGWRAFGGFGIVRFLAVETGYVSFGSPSDVVDGLTARQDLWGWDVTGVVKMALGPFEIFGRFGGIYWRAALDVGQRKIVYDVKDGIGSVYGGGVGLSIGKLGLRAEVAWHGIESTGDPILWSVGATIGF